MSRTTFNDVAQVYADAGWFAFPIDAARYDGGGIPTGYQVRDNFTPLAKSAWSTSSRVDCGVTAFPGIVGIDVDQYGSKTGSETLTELEARWGELPSTYSSTSRGADQPARIYWFRTPIIAESNLRNVFPRGWTDVDVIQSHHRFGAVYPTVSAKTGDTYRWYTPTGDLVPELVVPQVADLSELPSAWLEGMVAECKSVVKPQSVSTWEEKMTAVDQFATAGTPCNDVVETLEKYKTSAAAHYDAMVSTSLSLLRLGEQGHAGVRDALLELASWYAEYCDGLDGGRDSVGEFDRAVAGAADMVALGEPSENRNGCFGLFGCGYSHAMQVSDSDFTLEEIKRPWGKGNKPLPATAAAVIQEHLPVRVAPSGELIAWVDGYWNVTKSQNLIHRKIVALLGDGYTGTFDANICSILRASDEFRGDQDSAWLNVRNGLVNWRTGELRSHTPDHDSDYQFPVSWDPEATAPRFERFLSEVLDAEDRETILRMFGYCLLREYPIHKAFMLTGGGSNGKSVCLTALTNLLGRENTSSNQPQSFGSDRFSMGDLHGKFANIAMDVPSDRFVDTSAWKSLTSGDVVRFERKYEHAFNGRSYATQIASFNELPGTNDLTRGFLRRWVIVNFGQSFEGREEENLDATLAAELDGIFVLAVQALRRLMDDGNFAESDATKELVNKYREDSDPVAQFLDEKCTVGEFEVVADTLYQKYKFWSDTNGFGTMSSRKFATRVQLVHPEVEYPKRNIGRVFVGIKLS